ncbi:MAG: ATP-binding protein [Cyanobacteria bacterium P01_A01_bin.123]
MTIHRRIIYGYTLVLGFALTGTITGLFIGNHYQQRALEFQRLASAERKLLGELQTRILHNRPAKQLSPYLDSPVRFQAESQALLDRIEAIKAILNGHRLIHEEAYIANTTASEAGAVEQNAAVSDIELHVLLDGYELTVDQFKTRTETFVQAVTALGNTPEDLEIAEQVLLAFVTSLEFAAFIEFADQLAPFIDAVNQQEQAAETALHQAEILRTQIIIGSLLISAAIAVGLALYTSRAIARPIQTVTNVARRVTEENNFDLQAPVKSYDEVGILATSLNQLIQQVKRLLTQLGQKNADLEEALEQLNQQQMQLVQAEKMSSLGQLVAGVAHEINNPVSFIHGNLSHAQQYAEDLLNFVQLYQQHYSNPSAEIQREAEEIDLEFLQEDLPKMLNSMRLGTDRIRQIVLSLRNFSRMDEADFKDVNIHDGLDSTLLILQHRLKDTPEHPAIQVFKDYGDLPRVDCYPGQLNQVFMNILANAIDALEEVNAEQTYQEIRENPSQITLRTSVIENQWVQIEIADNGPGVPETVQRRVFDPFFTTKSLGKGTGMGMSISYQIITEKHGGKLTCISTPGEGATFIIQIPSRQQDNALGQEVTAPNHHNVVC